jgi:hypothetical protein
MSESDTGYQESPNTSDGGSGQDGTMVDGTPGHYPADRGERDTTLTTDDDAQRDDGTERPGNSSD